MRDLDYEDPDELEAKEIAEHLQLRAREFFVTTVAAYLGPLTIDLLVVAMTVGPLVIRLNILSVVGILLLAWFAKSLL